MCIAFVCDSGLPVFLAALSEAELAIIFLPYLLLFSSLALPSTVIHHGIHH
jgi:hypothetical protein